MSCAGAGSKVAVGAAATSLAALTDSAAAAAATVPAAPTDCAGKTPGCESLTGKATVVL